MVGSAVLRIIKEINLVSHVTAQIYDQELKDAKEIKIIECDRAGYERQGLREKVKKKTDTYKSSKYDFRIG